MKVLLPAPLGPSRPIVPGGTCTVTSASARCAPKVLERRSASMIKGTDARRATAGGDNSVASGFNAGSEAVAGAVHQNARMVTENLCAFPSAYSGDQNWAPLIDFTKGEIVCQWLRLIASASNQEAANRRLSCPR